MSMTRKDYWKVAEAVNRVRVRYVDPETVDEVARALADAFKEENPRFDEDLFLRAVRGEE